MDYLPVFLDLRERTCVLFGGSELALRKARLLHAAGGRVRVVATTLSDDMSAECEMRGFEHVRHEFDVSDFDEAALVIVATSDKELGRRISGLAHRRGLPVNVPDDPDHCSFILPSIVDRSPIIIAISTGGASPVLSRLLRGQIEAQVPPAIGRLADFAGALRDRVKGAIVDETARRRFWEWVLEGPVASFVLGGQESAAHEALDKALLEYAHSPPVFGEVYLVGAGPGDPELLTTRAVRLMSQADVVVHDHLVSDAVLNLTRRDARRIYAGKQRANHALAQETINELLVRLARDGKRVLRLKGGDPFIFGRGGEEIDTLAAHNVPFQVVPGITAASGCAAYAGIPLTHRDHAQSCVFVTGHLKSDQVNLDWESLVKPQQTVVIYMGLIGLPTIARELISHGACGSTPAALVEHGTTPDQRVLVGTLETLPGIVESRGVQAPTLTIIGDVVRLHEQLRWFNVADD
jgi:uroporphyrin-III C-methyltransferase/precorrin-2 dehydrogenase/sirohydrochlorin ferrochelatase